jgi:hypothetical protein
MKAAASGNKRRLMKERGARAAACAVLCYNEKPSDEMRETSEK